MNTPYHVLDRPDVLEYLFHPRRTPAWRQPASTREDVTIPVADGVGLGASLHLRDRDAPLLLFFHGNGEIVSDYDDLGGAFTRRAGVNFFVADYRGYGDSTGTPSVAAMMDDAYRVLDFVQHMMEEKRYTGGISVMGRSLGSAPALELASAFPDAFRSLVVESGFAWAGPLLRVLGLDPDAMGFKEEQGMGNLDKMSSVTCPCLVIHAQFDHLIPFTDGQALHGACPSETKELLEIKGANHNDIFFRGMGDYLARVKAFCCA